MVCWKTNHVELKRNQLETLQFVKLDKLAVQFSLLSGNPPCQWQAWLIDGQCHLMDKLSTLLPLLSTFSIV
jgi:hypothetical protein